MRKRARTSTTSKKKTLRTRTRTTAPRSRASSKSRSSSTSSRKRATPRRSRTGTTSRPRRRSKPAAARMTVNPIALLEKDHHEVDRLLTQARQDPQLFDRIKLALDVHAMIEEEIFYPAILSTAAGSGLPFIKEARHEHQEVKGLLIRMQALAPRSPDFAPSLERLTHDVRHHVREERTEVFPVARRLLGPAELSELGVRMRERKKELMAVLGAPQK